MTIFCLRYHSEVFVSVENHNNSIVTVISVFNFDIPDYVEDIYQSLLVAQQDNQLATAVEELKNMTPKPMNTMLEKQDKAVAIGIREQRKEMKVVDVPPTASGIIFMIKTSNFTQPVKWLTVV